MKTRPRKYAVEHKVTMILKSAVETVATMMYQKDGCYNLIEIMKGCQAFLQLESGTESEESQKDVHFAPFRTCGNAWRWFYHFGVKR